MRRQWICLCKRQNTGNTTATMANACVKKKWNVSWFECLRNKINTLEWNKNEAKYSRSVNLIHVVLFNCSFKKKSIHSSKAIISLTRTKLPECEREDIRRNRGPNPKQKTKGQTSIHVQETGEECEPGDSQTYLLLWS